MFKICSKTGVFTCVEGHNLTNPPSKSLLQNVIKKFWIWSFTDLPFKRSQTLSVSSVLCFSICRCLNVNVSTHDLFKTEGLNYRITDVQIHSYISLCFVIRLVYYLHRIGIFFTSGRYVTQQEVKSCALTRRGGEQLGVIALLNPAT